MTDSRLQCRPKLSVSKLSFPEDGLKTEAPSGANRKTPAEAPWIEYVAGQWVVVKRRRDVPPERRSFHAMRKHIDKLLELGWSITGRDPVRLEFHHRVKIVKGGLLIDG